MTPIVSNGPTSSTADNDDSGKDLRKRAIDAAIVAMSRNRALLMTINLICCVIIITIYLERISIDERQNRSYLFALQDVANRLRDKGFKATAVPLNAAQAESWALDEIGKGKDPEWIEAVTRETFRLHRIALAGNQVVIPLPNKLARGVFEALPGGNCDE